MNMASRQHRPLHRPAHRRSPDHQKQRQKRGALMRMRVTRITMIIRQEVCERVYAAEPAAYVQSPHKEVRV